MSGYSLTGQNTHLAKMLGTEGFTSGLARKIKSYSLKSDSQRLVNAFVRKKTMFSKMVQEKLSDEDRLVLGAYIGVLVKQSFNAGLKIGLTTSLFPVSEKKEG